MTKILFKYNEIESIINISSNLQMKEIFNDFSKQNNLSINDLSFLYKGKEIKEELYFNDFQFNSNGNEIEILVLEKNNYISAKYRINRTNEYILILGFAFVEKNKLHCKIIHEDKELNLIEKINTEEKNDKNILEIKIVGINNISDASFMFAQCNELISLPDINKWDTKKVVDMSNMFQECFSLCTLPDISIWDTSNVTDMKYMFYGCKSLLYLPDLSKWNISNVTNLSYMFDSCKSLSVLPDISCWNTSKVTAMNNMFFHCESLTFLPDISNWDMNNVIDLKYMFFSCYSLNKIPHISKWKIDNAISIFLFGFCINMTKIPPKFKSVIK